MIRRPPRSTLFPTRRSSDLVRVHRAAAGRGAENLMTRYVVGVDFGTLSGRAVVVRVADGARSEEHTSELQSQSNLVCRLLLEKKKIHGTRMRVVTINVVVAH